MNRAELITAIAAEMGATKKSVAEFVTAYEKVVVDTVAAGEDIQLRGFLTIERKAKKGQLAYNFATGEQIMLEDREVIKIHPGVAIKECVKK